jgi:hypothetical protein
MPQNFITASPISSRETVEKPFPNVAPTPDGAILEAFCFCFS